MVGMIGRKQLSEALYLSCVENYFLAWMAQMYPVERLYAQSFVGMRRVFADFSANAKYDDYSAVPRIQDTAERTGIVSHAFYGDCSVSDVETLVREQKDNELCIVRVNRIFQELYKRIPWREDHFLCIGRDFRWINQYPLSEGQFSADQFARFFGNAVIVYRAEDLSLLPHDENTPRIAGQMDFTFSVPSAMRAVEDAVGILRITRRRLEKFYQGNAAEFVLKEEVRMLDQLFLRIGLERIRGMTDTQKLHAEFVQIAALEKKLKETMA